MFDKLKQLKQIKDLQDALKNEKAEVEKEGIRVSVNGKMEIESIELNPGLDKESQERIVRECVNEALKKVQMIAAQKLYHMKGLNL
ncbi:MAG: YbaB/EbfC family nucleoid-associated protein [Candidatus Pacebacteria bacterium]|nr:YbaB/EbfC family nucleoid-associated protein [Candidatus Paceibacterota bacterium]